MNRIYLDHSATTPLGPEVLAAMMPSLAEDFGNPSSIHSFGQKTRNAVEDARGKIANILKSSANSIIFTSGGTESDNLAVRCIAHGAVKKYALEKGHLIVSPLEHHAVLDTARDLEKNFGFEISYMKVNKNGVVELNNLSELIQENTVLTSLMYANNEIGTIQPIAELAEKIKAINAERTNKIFVHTDAVQAAGYLELDVSALGVDALSLSAHKFYGPKGVGLLYLKTGTPYLPLLTGGGQEHNQRSGTENVAGIVGMASALQVPSLHARTVLATKELRDRLIDGVLKINNVELVGANAERLPNIASFIFKGIEAEPLLIGLDMEGIAASSGSACTVGSVEPSHVLSAMGYSREDARSLIRFSLGRENTADEIDHVLLKLPSIIERLKELKRA